ncbi:unnamed protein product [marine sediment metagenome]|uniref:Uncharacterized protein n=1 Tax=marine sediment metagenome TaxID=412755 RepID=X1DIV9_9ZZZZ
MKECIMERASVIKEVKRPKYSFYDWENALISGDNLAALKILTKEPKIKGKIRLIYIDLAYLRIDPSG